MRLQLLIATEDFDYAEHLSAVLAENYTDAINVCVCGSAEHLREQLTTRKIDVALLEPSIIGHADLQPINLPLLLWSESESIQDVPAEVNKVQKYQRISSMVSNILELYARKVTNAHGSFSKKARVTAVWSPMGGVGKTTTALAYCAGRIAEGKKALYLDLEQFSSVRAYFAEAGRSISAVFELLETGEGNIDLLVRSIRQQDCSSAIAYFCRPENFDDMNIMTSENIAALIDACSETTDELVIDMSCACDERARKVFELADKILLVTDSTRTAQIKFSQFVTQHNIFQQFRDKAALVANKGATVSEALTDMVIYLPYVQSADVSAIYQTLSRSLGQKSECLDSERDY